MPAFHNPRYLAARRAAAQRLRTYWNRERAMLRLTVRRTMANPRLTRAQKLYIFRSPGFQRTKLRVRQGIAYAKRVMEAVARDTPPPDSRFDRWGLNIPSRSYRRR